jgi:glycosyltransferase involved in cell wall biosynthesis
MSKMKTTGISVIMPTYNQVAFIRRAIASLYAQLHQVWELIIINDGCTDSTEDTIKEYFLDTRIRYFKNKKNEGLGYCLNKGMQQAAFNYICYLPSDDIFYANHLSSLLHKIESEHHFLWCYSGVNYGYADTPSGAFFNAELGKIEGSNLQLVQVMHKKTACKWVERKEMVTDDLDRMFWSKLTAEGNCTNTGIITCEWVDHPHQRHKIIQESNSGGIYLYKRYYTVNEPIIFQSTVGNLINEIDYYKDFRLPEVNSSKLKILIVGELAYNPERITALEKLGHKLYGLWIDDPHSYNTVGPLPFGNVTDFNLEEIEKQIEQVKPDIIYALLNYQAVPLANYILRANTGIPFVWHFKEGPFFCRKFGIWKELIELYSNADGRIYLGPEIRDWYQQFIEDDTRLTYLLDGDLPSGRWFTDNKTPLLSDTDGAVHIVASGRPYGILPAHVQHLADNNVHLHLYGNYNQHSYHTWIYEISKSGNNNLHLHPYCKPENWVQEYSQYDAGWLHVFTSDNKNELLKCTWDDLNYPARMATLAAAGLPMLQKNNTGNIVAAQALVKKLDMGIFFNSMEDLVVQLRDKKRIDTIRNNVWDNRKYFSFDYHAPGLIDFFNKVIACKKNEK